MKPDWEIESPLSTSRVARVFSPSNIALAKYWGKRDGAVNIPANSSISITLEEIGSFSTVEFNPKFKTDRLIVDGKEQAGTSLEKTVRVLDRARALSGCAFHARVQSRNNFPTGAGLASSASGLSAVAFGAARALEIDLPLAKVSELARLGSGSACRSIFGGFVEWKRGERSDGNDSFASQIFPASHWHLRVLIAVVNAGEKTKASTGGMELSRATSPYFSAWTESAERQVVGIRHAIAERNFAELAELSELNCLRMHACAMASVPPVFYWQPGTIAVMRKVREAREAGLPAFFTIDAGPNVVVICEPSAETAMENELRAVPDVTILKTWVGEGSRVLGETS